MWAVQQTHAGTDKQVILTMLACIDSVAAAPNLNDRSSQADTLKRCAAAAGPTIAVE